MAKRTEIDQLLDSIESKKKAATKRKKKAQREMYAQMREREQLVGRQSKSVAIRAKYGPTRKPAPVVVKTLDGTVVETITPVPRRRTQRGSKYSDLLESLARNAGYQSYAQYLESPHWLAFREKALSAAKYRCWKCKQPRENLTVHHNHYNTLGREHLSDVRVLCWRCHKRIHEK